MLPQRRIVELDNGTKVPIIKDAITKTKTKMKIPEAQIYENQTPMSANNIFRSKLEP